MSETYIGSETAGKLEDLKYSLQEIKLPYEIESAVPARTKKDAMVKQLDDYIIPRVKRTNAPLLAVIGGSTGAGKSTLVNGIVGKAVTRSGAIRPTTRQPILLHHPDDREWFSNARILPNLARITGTVVDDKSVKATEAGATPDAARIHSLVLVGDESIPKGLAILDAPDIDSVSDENRLLAKQLLAAADLWVFVTTANRYADAVPWEVLQQAVERDTTVTVVLDRVHKDEVKEISSDLAANLVKRGLADAKLFVVEEHPLDARAMLPAESIAPLRNWLVSLAENTDKRDAVMRRTLAGSVSALVSNVPDLEAAAKEQNEKEDELRNIVVDNYDEAIKNVIDSTQDGVLLRGELLSRWQDFVGTGEFFRNVEQKISTFRDKITSFVTGKPMTNPKVEAALESGLQTIMISEADKSAKKTAFAWNQDTAGKVILKGQDLTRASADFKDRAAKEIRNWQHSLLELVQSEGAGKRQQARFISLGVNGVATTLMIVVFASTAGLTGSEVVIAGGGAAIAQKLLEAVFGEEAVRRLAREARKDLVNRCMKLMMDEAQRFTGQLDEKDVKPQAIADLDNSVNSLDRHLKGEPDPEPAQIEPEFEDTTSVQVEANHEHEVAEEEQNTEVETEPTQEKTVPEKPKSAPVHKPKTNETKADPELDEDKLSDNG
ncbi:MAG: dynamin family protein [Micrococcaceae bacterium]